MSEEEESVEKRVSNVVDENIRLKSDLKEM